MIGIYRFFPAATGAELEAVMVDPEARVELSGLVSILASFVGSDRS
jgi:hypothetical protein